MEGTETRAAPAGWYADPELEGTQRYWDGAQWTEHRAPGAKPKKKLRAMTVVIWAWCALILVWAIAGGGGAANDCEGERYQDACEAGAGLGILLILFIGFIGFVFLSTIWFMTKPKDP